MKTRIALLMAAVACATSAFAHTGVKDPGVKARMETMKSASAAATVLGDMAKGKQNFDVKDAEDARSALVVALSAVPERFREPHADPKSEALPVIWEQFDDFLTENSEAIAAVESMELGDLDALRGSMRALGRACSGCHKVYKE